MAAPLNAFCYIEIPASDLEKARLFYSSVFGWKISSGMGDRYLVFSESTFGSGGLDGNAQAAAAGVLCDIKVEDIQATLRTITGSGGAVLKERIPVGGDNGYFALFKDPNGNRLGLWSKN